MGLLIDARTSMNMNETDPAPAPITSGIPFLVGTVGLNVPTTTPGILRVQFDGIFGLELPVEPEGTTIVTLSIVNGATDTDPIVYSSVQSFNSTVTGNQLVPLSASAYNVPAPVTGLLPYSLFATVDTEGASRAGPENFNVSVYSE